MNEMADAGPLESGREAFARQAWGDAFRGLSTADAAERLGIDDLERLALSAHMLGRIDDSARAWERAYHAAIARGQPARGVRCAFHLIWASASVENSPRPAAGMPARAMTRRGLDVVERGYILKSRRP